MMVELHIIQNFAPSNLNRDDTGSPKDCVFGGVRRARISSQCIKRAVREEFRRHSLVEETRRLLAPEELAYRTKILARKVADRLVEQGREREAADLAIKAALGGAGLASKDGKTEYLLYLGGAAVDALAEVCSEHWDTLTKQVEETGKEAAAKSKKKGKKDAKAAIPKEVGDAVLGIIDGARAADLGLFGRMLADLPKSNIDAASQVAHAVSTHKVTVEFDFYTAVDDLQPREETGAGMMDTVEFNSACFYRYANVDLNQLKTNLGGDDDLTRRTVEAFLRASKDAVPTGKQNSFAAHNPPAFILAVVRENCLPVNLINAFEKPVRQGYESGLVEPSIKALDDYWRDFSAMYGTEGVKALFASRMGGRPELEALGKMEGFAVVNFETLVRKVMEVAGFPEEARS